MPTGIMRQPARPKTIEVIMKTGVGRVGLVTNATGAVLVGLPKPPHPMFAGNVPLIVVGGPIGILVVDVIVQFPFPGL